MSRPHHDNPYRDEASSPPSRETPARPARPSSRRPPAAVRESREPERPAHPRRTRGAKPAPSPKPVAPKPVAPKPVASKPAPAKPAAPATRAAKPAPAKPHAASHAKVHARPHPHVHHDYVDPAPAPARRGRRRRGGGGGGGMPKMHLTSTPTSRTAYVATREWLLAQHGPVCAYCGRRFTASVMTLDHVAPRRGQSAFDRRDNLVLACPGCNSAKRDLAPMAFLLGSRSRAANLVRYGAHLSPMLVDMARGLAPEAAAEMGAVRVRETWDDDDDGPSPYAD